MGGRCSRSHLQVWEPRLDRKGGNRRGVCSRQVWLPPSFLPCASHNCLPPVLLQTLGCAQNAENEVCLWETECFLQPPETLVALQTIIPCHVSAFSGQSLLLGCGLPDTHTHRHTIHEVKLIVSHSLFQDAGICPLGSNGTLYKPLGVSFIQSFLPPIGTGLPQAPAPCQGENGDPQTDALCPGAHSTQHSSKRMRCGLMTVGPALCCFPFYGQG